MSNKFKLFLLSFCMYMLISNNTFAQQQEAKSYTFAIYFDNNWKVLSIICKDETNKIFPKQNKDGSINEGEYSNGFRFCCFGKKLLCQSSFSRLIALTNEEAINYQKYKRTSLSVRSSIRDYYLETEEFINTDNTTQCKIKDMNYQYHALFNPKANQLPLQSYMQKGSYMAITESGQDSLVTEGYTAYLTKDGRPNKDCYRRNIGDFSFYSECYQNRSDNQNDVYLFIFSYKGSEYFRVLSGNLYKACFLTDPNDKNSSMAVIPRLPSGIVDYVTGGLDGLFNSYTHGQTFEGVETNTTDFVKKMKRKYSNLILWSITKPTRQISDAVKFSEVEDVSSFARLLEQGYLKNQGLWKTLIDSDGGSWSDPQDDGIGAFEIFF